MSRMHARRTRSPDSLTINANTLTCFLLSSLGGPQSAYETDGTDVGLGEDTGMGTPRCEFQTFTRLWTSLWIPAPKARSSRITLFLPSQPLAPEKLQLPGHDTAYETLLEQEDAPTSSESFRFFFFELWRLASIPFTARHAAIQPPGKKTSGHGRIMAHAR